MKNLSTIKHTTGESPFDRIRLTTTDGSERWSARDLMPLMGYSAWRNFEVPLNRAMATAENQGQDVESNFARSRKITSTKPQEDYRLSRYAAYLVAMNGDPNKPEVAAAQNYFAVKTREAETQTAPALPQTYLEALKELVSAVEDNQQLTAQVEELTPKAEAFDGYLSASGDYSINEAAKLLARRGVQGIGQNRLRDHLLSWGWLYRGAKQRLRASQTQVDNGRLAERTSYYYDQVTGEKKAGSSPQPRVTPKGIDAIEKRLALAVVS